MPVLPEASPPRRSSWEASPLLSPPTSSAVGALNRVDLLLGDAGGYLC